MSPQAVEAIATEPPGSATHSPYLVQRLLGQKPNLYGDVKFLVIAEEIRKAAKVFGRPARILDLGCSTSISKHYLAMNGLEFEYCGVDYEPEFSPDIVMDIRNLEASAADLPWVPDVILLLDVLEHLEGKRADIETVMKACNRLVPEHGVILAVVPQLYRLDRLKLPHLHYPEHHVRFTLKEWRDILEGVTTVAKVRGIGYLSCLPYLPMFSPWYREDNAHGRFFRFLRGRVFEWPPLKPAEAFATRRLGQLPWMDGWCNSSLLICKGRQTRPTG